MPKLSDIRRIIPEDFPNDSREVAERIGGSYNEFADEVYSVMNGQLDFENLARSKAIIDLTFNATGIPTGSTNINTGLTSVAMVHIGKVENLSSPSARFSSSPYIDWSHLGNGLVRINYGIGFVAGSKYRLTLELIK